MEVGCDGGKCSLAALGDVVKNILARQCTCADQKVCNHNNVHFMINENEATANNKLRRASHNCRMLHVAGETLIFSCTNLQKANVKCCV